MYRSIVFLQMFLLLLLIACLVSVCVYLILRYFWHRRDLSKQAHMRADWCLQLLPLQLQAYERILVYADRIHPKNMLLRNPATGHTVASLQQLLLMEIRGEFQHNASQQIYVSEMAWQTLMSLKEDALSLVNANALQLSPDESGIALSRLIMAGLPQGDLDKYTAGLNLIKNEAKQLL